MGLRMLKAEEIVVLRCVRGAKSKDGTRGVAYREDVLAAMKPTPGQAAIDFCLEAGMLRVGRGRGGKPLRHTIALTTAGIAAIGRQTAVASADLQDRMSRASVERQKEVLSRLEGMLLAKDDPAVESEVRGVQVEADIEGPAAPTKLADRPGADGEEPAAVKRIVAGRPRR